MVEIQHGDFTKTGQTRMHSSRMRTASSLPYRGSLSGGLCPGVLCRGFSVWGSLSGASLSWRPPGQRPPCGQTDTCENITLPETSFASGN